MGADKRTHFEAILDLPRAQELWHKNYERPFNTNDIDKMYEAFVTIQKECLKEYSLLIPGCLKLMSALKNRSYKIGSTTDICCIMTRYAP